MTTTTAQASTDIAFHFPGTENDLYQAQENFHRMRDKQERFENMCNQNALIGLIGVVRKKYKNRPVTTIQVLKEIRMNGYNDDGFLKQKFDLTLNDIHRALDLGLVPQSIKASLGKYFNIKD